VQALLDHVRQTHPAVVKGLVPEIVGLGLVQRVLQHLLREGVSIRDLVAVLETVADEAEVTKDPIHMAEAARQRLAASICAQLADQHGNIPAYAFSPETESALAAATAVTERGPQLALDAPSALALRAAVERINDPNKRAVLICPQSLRVPLVRFVELAEVNVSVLGLAEVAPGYIVEAVETIDLAIHVTETHERFKRSNGKAAASNPVHAHTSRS
jgi:flagellar biosynthesis protein FlhA